MSNLYNQAKKNIKKTWILIASFLIFVIFLGWLFSYLLQNSFILWIAVVFAIFQSFLSYWYSDKIVLSITKAKPIQKKENPQLYQLVENLAKKANLPTPKIYIIDDEQPNAFATGRDQNHASIALTRGLLEKLEKEELEGVISHELAHIGNKDMLLQTMVVTLVGFVAILSNFFLRIAFWGGLKRDEREGNGILILLGLIAAILAPLTATLIQLAISRKREFLADATGALLTKNPEGLARALEKISRDNSLSKVSNPSVAHLFFICPFKGKKAESWFLKLFMTHPPIEERIKALRKISI